MTPRPYWEDDLKHLPWAVLVSVCVVTLAHKFAGIVIWP